MKFLVFGSLNIDRVFTFPKLPEKSDIPSDMKFDMHIGGKGLNQAVALARAGADVYMAGKVGSDGEALVSFLDSVGVNTDFVHISPESTGHADIEIDSDGENRITVYAGANGDITEDFCDSVLKNFGTGDLILLQYEISCVSYLIKQASKRGMIVAINPSQFKPEVKDLPFESVDILLVNESEAYDISEKKDVNSALTVLKRMTLGGATVITLGKNGVIFGDSQMNVSVDAFKVKAVDTTCAGDTFTGYFLTEYMNGAEESRALKIASAASAVVVQSVGAADVIPNRKTVEEFLESVEK